MIHTIYRYALAVALGAGLGCENDDGGGGGATDQEVLSTCKTYCEKAVVCDGDVMEAGCTADCQDKLGNCMADEQAQTLDDLEVCSAETCDDFKGCTIGAGLQCVFGI